MGRPKKCRWVETEPGVTFFKPRGIPLRSLQQIVITVDELEAMRLADFLEMTQEEVAQRMQVSRPTVTRMLSRAHRAVAEALVQQGFHQRRKQRIGCCRQRRGGQGQDEALPVRAHMAEKAQIKVAAVLH